MHNIVQMSNIVHIFESSNNIHHTTGKYMETVITQAIKIKKPSRSLIQVQQAIDNVARLNTNGQYDVKLMELQIELLDGQAWIKENSTTIRTRYVASPEEQRAIMSFNSDKRFTITE